MCYECWKEFKGWLRAFTRTEILLALLEAILLVICIGFVIFLILHLIACATWPRSDETGPSLTEDDHIKSTDSFDSKPGITSEDHWASTTTVSHTTLDPNVKCTWEPSKKTKAEKYYYEKSNSVVDKDKNLRIDSTTSTTTPMPKVEPLVSEDSPESGNVDKLAFDEQSDGEEAGNEYKWSVLALVKPRPPLDVIFGCALAVVSDRWTLTAASCVEAVEEIDSLDAFLIMERYGEARRGRTHVIADVQVHPLYQGTNRSHDIAALRSEDSLRPSATPLALPRLIDYFLITVGERLTILGFGSFRTIDQAFAARAVRAVAVYSLPGAVCRAAEAEAEAEGGAPAVRHLSRGRQDDHGAGGCGAAGLCAGVRYARGRACTYCAGTPLVRAGALLGVMAAARACALACEPARYAALAAPPNARWLDMLLRPAH